MLQFCCNLCILLCFNHCLTYGYLQDVFHTLKSLSGWNKRLICLFVKVVGDLWCSMLRLVHCLWLFAESYFCFFKIRVYIEIHGTELHCGGLSS